MRKRVHAGLLGVFLGLLGGCGLGIRLVVAAHDWPLGMTWLDVLTHTLINGGLAGFLAGVLRGPGRAGRWIEIPADSPQRIPTALSFCSHVGALIGGVLGGSLPVTITMNADLVAALAKSPAETWAALCPQGAWDLVGRIVLGMLLGFVVGTIVGGVLPRLNITDDEAAEATQPTVLAPRTLPTLDSHALFASSELDRRALSRILQTADVARDAKDYECVVRLLAPARRALPHALPARRTFPHALAVLQRLAEAYAELGRQQDAEQAFSEALEIDPNNFVSHYAFGNFWLDLAEVAKARSAFQQALDLNPAYADAWINLAAIAHDPAEAIRCLERAQAAGARHETLNAALTMWRDLSRQQEVRMDAQRLFWAEQELAENNVKAARLHLALARQYNLDDRLCAVAYKIESDLLRQHSALAGSVERLRQATELDPTPPAYWNTLSARENLLADQRLGTPQAVALRHRALAHALAAIQRGDYAMPHQNAAIACLALGQLQEARAQAVQARDMARQALEGNYVCVGCPTEGMNNLECQNCLRKAEGTLHDIALASGDYRAT